ISLYRASLSVIVLSLVLSIVIFQLEQRVLAHANRQAEILDAKIRGRAPRVFSALNRHWVMGRDGAIYHYDFFNTELKELRALRIYQPASDAWRLRTETVADRAAYRTGWIGHNVRIADFTTDSPRPQTF